MVEDYVADKNASAVLIDQLTRLCSVPGFFVNTEERTKECNG